MKPIIAVTGLNAGENPQPGVGVIRSLRRRFNDITIIGLAYDLMESGNFAPDGVDAVYQLPYPSAGSQALASRLDRIVANHQVNAIIPTLDAELPNFLKLQQSLANQGVQMMLPNEHSLERIGKSKLPAIAAEHRIPVPATHITYEVGNAVAAADEIGYPLLVKGPFYGAERVYSPIELRQQFHEQLAAWGGPVILQRSVVGDEYNFMAVGDGVGGAFGECAVKKTVLSKAGKAVGAVTIEDEDLNRLSRRIIHALQWHGPIELEWIRESATGVFHLIEVNPRFPAWVDFPSNFDCNLPAMVVEGLLTGVMPTAAACRPGRFFLRHCYEVVGDMSQLAELSTNGELRHSQRAGNVVTTSSDRLRTADIAHSLSEIQPGG